MWSGYDPPAEPTWVADVQPIFQQYANLYPIMRDVVDLGDYSDVAQRHWRALSLAMGLPVSGPNYMPVTRDLSPAKSKMIVGWLQRQPDPPVFWIDSLKSLLLNAVGGKPNIASPAFAPRYPGHLPGGVRPNLTVSLRRCSIAQVRDVFMQIEEPRAPLDIPDDVPSFVDKVSHLGATLPNRADQTSSRHRYRDARPRPTPGAGGHAVPRPCGLPRGPPAGADRGRRGGLGERRKRRRPSCRRQATLTGATRAPSPRRPRTRCSLLARAIGSTSRTCERVAGCLVDLSAWAHSGHVDARMPWEALLEADDLLCHPVFAVELLHNAINPADYRRLREDLETGFAWVWPDGATARIAVEMQQRMATSTPTGHRVKTPDLLIAALAVQLDVGVLHYDADYDVIRDHGGEPFQSEWLAKRGSLAGAQHKATSARRMYSKAGASNGPATR